jgi:DNA gyrase subunit B
MDEYLLKLGHSDVSLRLAGQHDLLAKEQIEALLGAIREVESFIGSIERKGIPFREFSQAKNEEGKLPRFQVALGDHYKFVYSEEEFAELKKTDEAIQREKHEIKIASIPEGERTEEIVLFRIKSLPCIELFEEARLENIRDRLSLFCFSFEQYFTSEGKLFDIIQDDGSEVPIYNLKEGIDFFRANGRKGIEIQRYKGLGEMNADQLWETTMDPKQRTLLKVTLPDAIAADHMFTMLMGEEVPPRRAFIEQHALSVKNLDI